MNRNGTSENCADAKPGKKEILIQLDAVCRSPRFRQSPRLVDILKFLVDTELAGVNVTPTSRDIALNVFGKNEGFSSKSDSTVRVACNRLRNALSLYNAQVKPTVLILLAPGSNRPAFEFNRTSFSLAKEALFLAEWYQNIASRSAHRLALSKVQYALEREPENAELLAASADLTLDGYKHGYQRNGGQLEEAVRCAELAYSIHKTSAKVLLSRAMISLELGLFDDVRRYGQSLMAKGDDESTLFGKWMCDVVSDTPANLYEEHTVASDSSLPAGWLHHTRFLSAYSIGDYEAALTEAIGFGMNEFFWSAVDRSAALGQLGLPTAANRELERAIELNPDLPGNFNRYLKSYVPHPNVRMHLLEGIERVSRNVL